LMLFFSIVDLVFTFVASSFELLINKSCFISEKKKETVICFQLAHPCCSLDKEVTTDII
jgi:hypothetical protein